MPCSSALTRSPLSATTCPTCRRWRSRASRWRSPTRIPGWPNVLIGRPAEVVARAPHVKWPTSFLSPRAASPRNRSVGDEIAEVRARSRHTRADRATRARHRRCPRRVLVAGALAQGERLRRPAAFGLCVDQFPLVVLRRGRPTQLRHECAAPGTSRRRRIALYQPTQVRPALEPARRAGLVGRFELCLGRQGWHAAEAAGRGIYAPSGLRR